MKNIVNALTGIMLLLFVSVPSPSLAASDSIPALSDKDIETIKTLSAFMNKNINDDETKILESHLASDSYVPRALATAILYKHNQPKYEKPFFDTFAVHDYRARSQGNYNMIQQQELLEEIKQVESKYPEFKGSVVTQLVLFDLYREQNKWIKLKQNLSLARFFRSAFLAGAFRNTKLDAVDLTNQIDRITRTKDLSKK